MNRSSGVPSRSWTARAKLGLPIRSAPACPRTARIARRCVPQHSPTQWPSPPWIETAFGTPRRRLASSAARPVGYPYWAWITSNGASRWRAAMVETISSMSASKSPDDCSPTDSSPTMSTPGTGIGGPSP